jgi:hypothetical protein
VVNVTLSCLFSVTPTSFSAPAGRLSIVTSLLSPLKLICQLVTSSKLPEALAVRLAVPPELWQSGRVENAASRSS